MNDRIYVGKALNNIESIFELASVLLLHLLARIVSCEEEHVQGSTSTDNDVELMMPTGSFKHWWKQKAMPLQTVCNGLYFTSTNKIISIVVKMICWERFDCHSFSMSHLGLKMIIKCHHLQLVITKFGSKIHKYRLINYTNFLFSVSILKKTIELSLRVSSVASLFSNIHPSWLPSYKYKDISQYNSITELLEGFMRTAEWNKWESNRKYLNIDLDLKQLWLAMDRIQKFSLSWLLYTTKGICYT